MIHRKGKSTEGQDGQGDENVEGLTMKTSDPSNSTSPWIFMATSWHQIIKTIFSSSNGIAFVIIITIFLQSKNDKDNLKWKTVTRCKINGNKFGDGAEFAWENLQAGTPQGIKAERGLAGSLLTSSGKSEGNDSVFYRKPLVTVTFVSPSNRRWNVLFLLFIICDINNGYTKAQMPCPVLTCPFVNVPIGLHERLCPLKPSDMMGNYNPPRETLANLRTY